MGGGEDLPQTLATRRLLADGGLHEAAGRGAVVFAVCAGYQMLGTEFGGADDAPVQGLGLLDIRSGRGEERAVGEVVADVDPRLNVGQLTGFENHQGVTRLGPNARPLARTTLGTGNGGRHRGRLPGPGARHLPARPRARPQPWPGRPAAATGRPGRCRRCRRRPRSWQTGCARERLAAVAAVISPGNQPWLSRGSVDERLNVLRDHLGDERRRARRS